MKIPAPLRFMSIRKARAPKSTPPPSLQHADPQYSVPLFVRWDLEAAFMLGLKNFDALLADAVAGRLGEWIRDGWDFGDQVQILEDLGVLDEAMKSDWADCLAARSRLLVLKDPERPDNEELRHAVAVMDELNATLSQRVQTFTTDLEAPMDLPP